MHGKLTTYLEQIVTTYILLWLPQLFGIYRQRHSITSCKGEDFNSNVEWQSLIKRQCGMAKPKATIKLLKQFSINFHES